MEQTEKQQDNKVMLNQVHHPEEVYIYTCIYKHTYIHKNTHAYIHALVLTLPELILFTDFVTVN